MMCYMADSRAEVGCLPSTYDSQAWRLLQRGMEMHVDGVACNTTRVWSRLISETIPTTDADENAHAGCHHEDGRRGSVERRARLGCMRNRPFMSRGLGIMACGVDELLPMSNIGKVAFIVMGTRRFGSGPRER